MIRDCLKKIQPSMSNGLNISYNMRDNISFVRFYSQVPGLFASNCFQWFRCFETNEIMLAGRSRLISQKEKKDI